MRSLQHSWPWLVVSSIVGALVALQYYAWRTWLEVAPLARQGEASQAVTAHLIEQHGTDVAAYALPAPPLLTSFAMLCWLVIPSLLAALAISRRVVGSEALGLASLRLWGWLALHLGLWFAVAAVASGRLPSALPWTEQLGWAASYWVRTALFALPFAALFTSVVIGQPSVLRRVLRGVGSLLVLWLATVLAPEPLSALMPAHSITSLVRIEPRAVVRGLLLVLLWSATFVFLFPLVFKKVRARLAAHTGVDMTATNKGQVVAAVLLAAMLSSASPALAYSKPGHFGITDAAWQVMRAGATSKIYETGLPILAKPPSNVSKQDWENYLAELTVAHQTLGNFPIDVPDANNGTCLGIPRNTQLNQLKKAITPDHFSLMQDNQCGVNNSYVPAGAYRILGPANDSPFGGTALGYHAKNRDDDIYETRIDALPGARAVFEGGSTAWTAATAAVFAPFVCAYKAIASLWGEGGNCLDSAKALAEKGDFFAAISGSIPGADLPRSEDIIGFWHLINVRQSGLTNQFDNNQGMYLPEGGPEALPGALDFAGIAASVVGGINLDAKESKGVRRYSVESSADGHPATKHRSDWEWSAHAAGVTPMSPLDNLAYGGYNLPGLGRTERLGWPLHAIGDATVPMHVVASPGWGHQAYEEWVETHLESLTHGGRCPPDGTDCKKFETDQFNAQVAQAQRVLAISYQWRNFLKTHGLRDLITELAKQTLQKAGGDQVAGWAWCDSCSVFFLTGKKWKQGSDAVAKAAGLLKAWDGKFDPLVANNPSAYYSQFSENIRGLVEDAMGAKIAFLIWASQQK